MNKCGHLHNNFLNVCGETKMFFVEIFVIHEFDPWQCGEFLYSSSEKFGSIHAVNGYWRLVMHKPALFSIPHSKPHSSSPTFFCLQHLIQYICSHSPCWRMCKVSELENDPLTFQSDVCGHRKQAGRTDIVQHGSPTCSSQPLW